MPDLQKYFKEGEEVAHKDNLSIRMEVRKIVRTKKEEKTYTIGIECGWWDGDTYIKERFHTCKLIPWAIAERGYVAVAEYIDKKNNIKV